MSDHPDTPSEPRTHGSFRLVFRDEVGDLARCECGEQGFDFNDGETWFAEHVASRVSEGATEALARAMIDDGGTPPLWDVTGPSIRAQAIRRAEPIIGRLASEGWSLVHDGTTEPR